MFEGSFNTQSDEAIEEPFDYVAEAKRLREEREAKVSKEKSEKDAKEKQKREDRIAKKLADSVSKREASEKKDAEYKAAAEKTEEQLVKQEAVDHVAPEAKDIEMTASSGSEYVAELKEGEGAVLLFNHDTQKQPSSTRKAEEASALVEQVSEQAIALAKARDAVRLVESADMGTHTPTDESAPVYDLGTEQHELQDRIQHAWDSAPTRPLDPRESMTPPPAREPEEVYPTHEGSIERAPDPVSPVTTTIKNSLAHVSGLLSGRSRPLRTTEKPSELYMGEEASSIRRDIEAIQKQSEHYEFQVPEQLDEIPESQTSLLTPESIGFSQYPEVSGTDAPAIPAWIYTLEKDIKFGKIEALKKWQIDILRVQHPELLSQYEQLMSNSFETAEHHSREVLSHQFEPESLPQPGELPSPALSLPAYMNVTAPTPHTVYDYATVSSGATSTTLTPNSYLAIVIIGGIAFGLALIFAFGF